MNIKKVNIMIIFSLGLFLSGCATQPKVAHVTSEENIDKNFGYGKPIILRGENNNIIKSQLILRNKTLFEQTIQYQLKWYDKNGFEIKSLSSYEDVRVIKPNSELVISKVAPNKYTYSLQYYVKTPQGERIIRSNDDINENKTN